MPAGSGSMGRILTFAALALVVGTLTARLVDRGGPTPGTPSAMAAATAAGASDSSANAGRVTLLRGNGGHFWTDARIDGRRLEMVVDTGASAIALRASDAAMLGYHPVERDYSIRVATANGMTRAALVRLRRVEIGDITVYDVPALIHENGLSANLLGMTFLSRVRWTHERGKLVLEQ
jgi:aspartyl protease family protein